MMALFWGFPRRIQYGLAIGLAIALAFPFICAMFLVLSFGMGMLAWLAVVGIVFGVPIWRGVWRFVWKRKERGAKRRAEIWHAWALCLIVHLGFSAGFCRVWQYMPNAPNVKEGPFVQDYLQVVFIPVVAVYAIAQIGHARDPAKDSTKVRPG